MLPFVFIVKCNLVWIFCYSFSLCQRSWNFLPSWFPALVANLPMIPLSVSDPDSQPKLDDWHYFGCSCSFCSVTASTSYTKQKASLQKDLESFLDSLPFPKGISTTTPCDLCRFLVWKDRKGKTKVHKINCQFFTSRGLFSCPCPRHLGYGTVDSLIRKLGAIFNEFGRRG